MKKRFDTGKFFEELILLISTVIILAPVYYFVIGAFKPRKSIVQHPLIITREMFTLGNFPRAIKAMKYWKAVQNTGTITLVSLILIIFCASLAGFAIARIRFKFFDAYYSLLVTCMVIPFVACVIPLVVQSVNLGTHNSLLGPILIQTGWNIPFATFLFTGFMRGISRDLDYLVSLSILSVTDFPTLMVGMNGFFSEKGNELGYAFAGILLASIPMIVLFLFLQKYFIKGIAAGSVKG